MTRHRVAPILVVLASIVSVAADRPTGKAGSGRVDFDRDVRPVLAEHCFPCHGPDAGKRKADLRLDTKQGASGRTTAISSSSPASPRRANWSTGSAPTTRTR